MLRQSSRHGLFDSSGYLWATNNGNGKLDESSRMALAESGPVPTMAISPDASGDITGAINVAFDAAGNRWVSNYQGNTLVEFTKGQFAKSDPPAAGCHPSYTDHLVAGRCTTRALNWCFSPLSGSLLADHTTMSPAA